MGDRIAGRSHISGNRLTQARWATYTPRSVRVPHRSTTSMEDGKQMSQMLLYVPTIAPDGAADRGRSVPFSR